MESQKACNQPEQTVRTLIFHVCIYAFSILYVLINGRDRARNRHSTYSENFPHIGVTSPLMSRMLLDMISILVPEDVSGTTDSRRVKKIVICESNIAGSSKY